MILEIRATGGRLLLLGVPGLDNIWNIVPGKVSMPLKTTIFSFLTPTILNTIKYHIVSSSLKENYNNIRLFAVLRIQLAYKVNREAKKQDEIIKFQLNKMFKSGPPFQCIPKGSCVYYAPVVPNSICRFCTGYLKDHKISERLILNHYIPKIVPLYSEY